MKGGRKKRINLKLAKAKKKEVRGSKHDGNGEQWIHELLAKSMQLPIISVIAFKIISI